MDTDLSLSLDWPRRLAVYAKAHTS
jgi:hypothetical protein